MNKLSFEVLRAANLARLPTFKSLRLGGPDGPGWTPAQWLQALVGEIGEYANLRKKYERGDIGWNEFSDKAADELADVQCYLDILASQLDIDLGQATQDKFNRVSARYGMPILILVGDDGTLGVYDGRNDL